MRQLCALPLNLLLFLSLLILLNTSVYGFRIYTNVPKTDVQRILIQPTGQPNDTCTISEEIPNNQCSCPSDQLAIGSKCNGRFCNQVTWTCSSATDQRGVRYSYNPLQTREIGRYTTDGDSPIICPDNQVAVSVRCDDRWCNNMYLECSNVSISPDQRNFDTVVETGQTEQQGCYWSRQFSEEGQNWQHCPDGKWVRGLQCFGQYCDRLSWYCCPVIARVKPCQFTDWSKPTCARLSFAVNECGPQKGVWRYTRRVTQQNELGNCNQLTIKNDGVCDVDCNNAEPLVNIPPISPDIPGIIVDIFPSNTTNNGTNASGNTSSNIALSKR